MSETGDYKFPQDPSEVIELLRKRFERDVAFMDSNAPAETASPVEHIAFGFFANRLEADALFLQRMKEVFPGSEEVTPEPTESPKD